MPVRRRVWLGWALGLLGPALLPWPLRGKAAGRGPASPADPYGFDALGGRAALAPQGAIYLCAHPLERDPLVLLRLLAPDPAMPLHAALLAAVDRDWRRHDVVAVDGWILARSEARICALACLTASA